MAQSKTSKRPYIESSDSDSDSPFSSYFPHFIVLESLEEKSLAKVSPFVIQKTLSGIVTPKSVKKLKNGTLLVEIDRKTYAENLLKLKTFFNIKIKSYPHTTLNTSRGVIKSSELSLCNLEEIKTNLNSQGVIDVRRISIRRNSETIETNTYILTFNHPQVPKEIKIGYQIERVNVYVPNPLRCFKCQMFGHHEDRCTRQPICKRCGGNDSNHQESNCDKELHCANCGEAHSADSKICRIWKKEKEIMQVKYTRNISFPEARKIVNNTGNHSATSFAAVTKITPTIEPTSTPIQKTTLASTQHKCHSCTLLIEKLKQLTPDNLPDFIESLSESNQSTNQPIEPIQSTWKAKPSTQSTQTFLSSTKTVHASTTTQKKPTLPVETPKWTPPPLQNGTTKSPDRDGYRSPPKTCRQSPTPRIKIQLEKTNSKNPYKVLETEEIMDTGEEQRSPSSTKTKNSGKSQSQKTQRKANNK